MGVSEPKRGHQKPKKKEMAVLFFANSIREARHTATGEASKAK